MPRGRPPCAALARSRRVYDPGLPVRRDGAARAGHCTPSDLLDELGLTRGVGGRVLEAARFQLFIYRIWGRESKLLLRNLPPSLRVLRFCPAWASSMCRARREHALRRVFQKTWRPGKHPGLWTLAGWAWASRWTICATAKRATRCVRRPAGPAPVAHADRRTRNADLHVPAHPDAGAGFGGISSLSFRHTGNSLLG